MKVLICTNTGTTPSMTDIHQADFVVHEIKLAGQTMHKCDVYFVSKNRYGDGNVFIKKSDLAAFIDSNKPGL